MPGDKATVRRGKGVIGARVAVLRKERGMTQVELAKRLGIPQPVLSRYERGKARLSAEMVLRIAEVLEVSTDMILGLTRRDEERLLGTPRLRRLLHQAEALSRRDRQALLRTIEGFLRGNVKRSRQAAAMSGPNDAT